MKRILLALYLCATAHSIAVPTRLDHGLIVSGSVQADLFTGDGSALSNVVWADQAGYATDSSYAESASYADQSGTASYADVSATSSNADRATYSDNATSASFASFAESVSSLTNHSVSELNNDVGYMSIGDGSEIFMPVGLVPASNTYYETGFVDPENSNRVVRLIGGEDANWGVQFGTGSQITMLDANETEVQNSLRISTAMGDYTIVHNGNLYLLGLDAGLADAAAIQQLQSDIGNAEYAASEAYDQAYTAIGWGNHADQGYARQNDVESWVANQNFMHSGDSVGYAENAGSATRAESAASADSTENASHANNADWARDAQDADNATYAQSAQSVDYLTGHNVSELNNDLNYVRWVATPENNASAGESGMLSCDGTNFFIYSESDGQWLRVQGTFDW